MLSVCVKYWFTAQFIMPVLTNDLNLIKELMKHTNVIKKVTKEAVKDISRHIILSGHFLISQ